MAWISHFEEKLLQGKENMEDAEEREGRIVI